MMCGDMDMIFASLTIFSRQKYEKKEKRHFLVTLVANLHFQFTLISFGKKNIKMKLI